VDSSPILVVEDDDLVRSFLTKALFGLAGDVDACATGEEATQAVQRRRFGVILLDGLLPDTHGIDLAKRLIGHANTSRSGICFVSGSLRHPLSMRSGVSALPKPLRLRELTDAVELLLDWHSGAAAPPAERLAALDALGADLLVR
jgi:two-component system OmpR family response regulator